MQRTTQIKIYGCSTAWKFQAERERLEEYRARLQLGPELCRLYDAQSAPFPTHSFLPEPEELRRHKDRSIT